MILVSFPSAKKGFRLVPLCEEGLLTDMEEMETWDLGPWSQEDRADLTLSLNTWQLSGQESLVRSVPHSASSLFCDSVSVFHVQTPQEENPISLLQWWKLN